ncbi:MAG: 50S ribosomal protein L31e [Candidatus Methanomethylicota archaeon]|uniref:Large ribosomal subunit protein eL31 n=1 Tax=Thermoproteota archaeon TaxID=2056631 RepID=A0A497EX03_9CREN|nr:MAG: 50S ribosomal protein L31e [Candidatus Verstraetearchaeota archaeon]RLE55906.1 MAG: 50S ribosomal protein L31e [Candidatus Verstraetearchaeota archaeon]
MSSGEEGAKIVEERIYVVPFRIAFFVPRPKRVPRAIRFLRSFVQRHMKTDKVWISPEVNEAIWSRGKKKPPRRIKVRAVKEEDGTVKVYLAES